MRLCIIAQKFTVSCGYAAFLVLFLRLKDDTANESARWVLFALITGLSAFLNLATVRQWSK